VCSQNVVPFISDQHREKMVSAAFIMLSIASCYGFKACNEGNSEESEEESQ
jgi:hypothetical protein